ncbi:MAG: MBL fold metallo-hydrolase [Lachnospiraceae bacterium]|nr:MBL fold metallo-hydrolase [Lachnospiraceae bacterium]
MRQKGQRRWFGGILVTGLFAAAVMSGPGTDLTAGEGLLVKKSGFGMTEFVAAEVARLQSPNQSGTDTGSPAQGQAPPSSSSQNQGSNTVVAGAGSSQNTPGPSMYGNIVTEGEKEVHPQDAILGGATLTLLRSQSDSQMLSAILQTSQGKLIVVDGGLGADGDYLRSQIQARGSHVAAWLITHPHGDHAGALYRILQDEAAGVQSGIQIDGIYYSFASPEWYTINDTEEQTMAHAIIGSFSGLPETMLHTVGRGQTIQVDDVTIQVMNDRYEASSDKGNNAGIVYKLWVNGKSILFLGDMAEEGGRRLLAESGPEALRSDIVQMAHHGQNGVDEEFYKAVNPSICLWPTPQWLWNSVGSRYRTSETKGWMTHLNVQKHYCTKDGDQIIY